MATSPDLRVIFRELPSHREFWERNFCRYELEWKSEGSDNHWQQCWKEAHGDNAVMVEGSEGVFLDSLRTKGYKPVTIRDSNWSNVMQKRGIPRIWDVLHDVNDRGHQLEDPSPSDEKMLDTVWSWFELLGLTANKQKPSLKIFQNINEGDMMVEGYYTNETVHIGRNFRTSYQTYYEEVAHHISGCSDVSHGFQSFLINAGTQACLQALGE
jgi:hypothetical protein